MASFKSLATVLISSLVELRPTSTATLQSDSFPLLAGTSRCETSGHLCIRGFQTRALRAPASLINYAPETRSAFAVRACVCQRGHQHQGLDVQ